MTLTYAPHWLMILTALGGVLGSMGLGGLLKTWLDHKRGMRKQTDDMSLGIVEEVKGLLQDLTKARAEDRRFYEAQAARQEQHQLLCEANLKLEHHRVNNLNGNLRSIFDMAKLAPEKMPEILSIASERMAEDFARETMEKNAITAMRASFGLPPDEDHPAIEEAA